MALILARFGGASLAGCGHGTSLRRFWHILGCIPGGADFDYPAWFSWHILVLLPRRTLLALIGPWSRERRFYFWYLGVFSLEPPWFVQMHHFTFMLLLMQSLRSASLHAYLPAATILPLHIGFRREACLLRAADLLPLPTYGPRVWHLHFNRRRLDQEPLSGRR